MQVFGHRGSPGFPRYGENTLASFRRALEEGADGVEFDVRRCGDKSLIVIHDATLSRTTNGDGTVATLPYSELSRFDAGHGEAIPLLSFILDQLGGKCRLNIELKEPELVDDVAALVMSRGLNEDVIVSAFETYWTELGSISSQIPVGLLATSSEIRRLGVDGFIQEALKLRAESLHIPQEAVDRDLVRAAHDAHLKVRVFTVNTNEQVLRLRDLGVDAIFSDYPGRSVQAVRTGT